MIAFIDQMKTRFGVELVCRTMRAAEVGFVTARGYRAAKSRPAVARPLSDQLIGGEIARLHAENYSVYGVRKMHRLLKREGWEIGRDQTGRIMRSLGLRGVQRGKRVFTTKSDPADVYSRRIVGWNVASTLKADILPLQALDMAAFDAGGNLTGLTHHSDHGSNYMAMVYTDRIVDLGAIPSTGTVGDSYDNAMAEAINALYKTELIRARGPWRTVERVELATLEWVWWWNDQRLHSELDYRTPIEAEQAHYVDPESLLEATASQEHT